jgi:hypothetical protein
MTTITTAALRESIAARQKAEISNAKSIASWPSTVARSICHPAGRLLTNQCIPNAEARRTHARTFSNVDQIDRMVRRWKRRRAATMPQDRRDQTEPR